MYRKSLLYKLGSNTIDIMKMKFALFLQEEQIITKSLYISNTAEVPDNEG